MSHVRQNETPEERAHRIETLRAEAAERRVGLEARAHVGGRYMRANRLRIIHLPREDGFSGATVVYRHPSGSFCKNVIEFASALQHPNDPYIKTEGRYFAAQRFNDGQTALMRIPQGVSPESFLIAVFGN